MPEYNIDIGQTLSFISMYEYSSTLYVITSTPENRD
jgi:hypothetical protein